MVTDQHVKGGAIMDHRGGGNSDCLSQNRQNAYVRYYTFRLLQRSDVTITLKSETAPYLFLLGGSGVGVDYLVVLDEIVT